MMCCVSQGQREESDVDEGLAAKEAQELYDVCVVCVCVHAYSEKKCHIQMGLTGISAPTFTYEIYSTTTGLVLFLFQDDYPHWLIVLC